MGGIAALIDAVGPQEVVLIGHDWGAMVARCFAAARRRQLHRPVIMNVPHPLCFQAALRRSRQIRKSWYIALFQIPWLPERMLAAGGEGMVRRMFAGVSLPRDVLTVYRDQIADPCAATAMLNWYRAMRGRTIPAPDLARVIEVPTLIIWAEEDVALDTICLDNTERYVRGLTVRRPPGVSHWVQQHAPEAVNELLRGFLSPADGDLTE